MVWLEDPLTGDVPHRGVVEEEDEAQAQELAPQHAAQPSVQWADGQAPAEGATVVFLVGQAACLLAAAFFPRTQAVGAIVVPELVRVRSPLEEEYGTTRTPLHTCTLRAPAAGAGAALLLAECPCELPAEQAAAWARAALGALRPRAAVVAATLPAMSYRGPGDAADEDLIFALQTAAAAAAASGSTALPPPLPEATVLGGLAAALLTRCELAGLPAVAVAGVQAQQVPDAAFLYCLGQGVAAALAAVGGAGAAGAAPDKAQALAALRAAADGVYRSSASSSIFS